MIVELAGAPGGGKSAVAHALSLGTADGLRVLTGDDAVLACLRRSPVTRSLLRIGGEGAAGLVRRIGVDIPGGVVAAATHPVLVARVLRSILASPLPAGHRLLLVRRFLVAAARGAFLRRHLAPDELAIVDEGLVHRVVNTFAWRIPEASLREVRRYLAAIPQPDALIVIEASRDVRRDRLGRRGLPGRLRGRSPEAVDGFLDRADRLLGIASATMRGRVPTVNVENDGPLESTVAEVRAALACFRRQAATGAGTRHLAWPSWPRDAPRLDRRLGRARSRDPLRGGADPAVQQVLASLGRRPTGDARVVAVGRSESTIVPTDAGPVLLKRYKDSLDDAAIESEHAVLRELARQGIGAPRLVIGADGESRVRVGTGRYAAFHYLDGYHPAHERLVLPRSRSASIGGAVLGGLHRALQAFEPPTDAPAGLAATTRHRVRDASWHAARVDEAMSITIDGDAELRRRSTWIVDRLDGLERDLLAAQLPITTIHGDYGPYNLLVRAGVPVVPIDFELARLDWRVVDVVTALPRFSRGRLGRHRGAARRFLDAYDDVATMRREERDALPHVAVYLALRRVAVTWSRAASSDGHLDEARAWLGRAMASDAVAGIAVPDARAGV